MEESIYFVHVNGQQKGPFTLSQLPAEGVTLQTMIWRPGLNEWVVAAQLPEVSAFLSNSYPQIETPPIPPFEQPSGTNLYGQPSFPSYPHQSSPYSSPNPYYGSQPNYGQQYGMYPAGWTNWLPWAIVATVIAVLFCGLLNTVFGIIGIVKANSANDAARRGMPEARELKSSAKTWTIISLALSGIALISWIIFLNLGNNFF